MFFIIIFVILHKDTKLFSSFVFVTIVNIFDINSSVVAFAFSSLSIDITLIKDKIILNIKFEFSVLKLEVNNLRRLIEKSLLFLDSTLTKFVIEVITISN